MRHEWNSTGDFWKVSVLLRRKQCPFLVQEECPFLPRDVIASGENILLLQRELLQDKDNILRTEKHRDEDNLCPQHFKLLIVLHLEPTTSGIPISDRWIALYD